MLARPEGTAHALLEEMLSLAACYRGAADAKVLALVDWIRRHQCAAAKVGGAEPGADGGWSDRRILVFTEYGDTKRYLQQVLSQAIEGTAEWGERIMQLHGGMSDEQREEVQRAFNSPPEDHPVRILLATDAAREGVNLQGHCADLFHYDVPWNPARMEQRNGRIDRALQSAPEVRCHYFLYPDRTEDLVLDKLVQKIDVIQRELGSLSAVPMDRMAGVLEDGIDEKTASRLERAEQMGNMREVVRAELEAQRWAEHQLRREVEECGKILNRSRAVMEFDPALLRDAIDVGLELSGSTGLRPANSSPVTLDSSWLVPELPDSWQRTLD